LGILIINLNSGILHSQFVSSSVDTPTSTVGIFRSLEMVAIMAIVMSSERNDSCGCGGGSGFLVYYVVNFIQLILGKEVKTHKSLQTLMIKQCWVRKIISNSYPRMPKLKSKIK